MKIENVFYLPSGRIFLNNCNGYLIESTEMRDVSTSGKEHLEVRESMDPHVIWKHLKPYYEKWLLTVSTQKGCPHACHFCDVGNLKFEGNLTVDEITLQIQQLLSCTPHVCESNKVKIGFARMGEPAHNILNVLQVINNLYNISSDMGKAFIWLPCFNTILPKKTLEGYTGFDIIDRVIETKERNLHGFLHFQLSINSTCEEKRKELFAGAEVVPLQDIITYINYKDITNRTITLNFIVMEDVEVDVNKLKKMGLNGDKLQ